MNPPQHTSMADEGPAPTHNDNEGISNSSGLLGTIVDWIQAHREPIKAVVWVATLATIAIAAFAAWTVVRWTREQKAYVQHRIQHAESFWFLPCFRLGVCLFLDGIGAILSLLPGFGQLVGVCWGSLAALLLYVLFLSKNTGGTDDPFRRNERWRHMLLIAFGWFEESVPIPLVGAIPTGLMVWIDRYWPILGHATWRFVRYCQTQIQTKRGGTHKEE